MKLDILQKIGLHANSTAIYKSLLNKSPLTVSEIAKTTGLYRPVVYKYLSPLLQQQLISKTTFGKRTVYFAESPDNLKGIIDNLSSELVESLPELIHSYKQGQNTLVIRNFEGRNGIGYVYESLFKPRHEQDIIYRYESPKDHKRNSKFYPPMYREISHSNKRIQKFVITNQKTMAERSPRLDRYTKAVSARFDNFDYDLTQLIYGDKVAFIDYENETASIIENAKFAKFQRQIFKLLFEKL